jgi:hypothetical protein
VKKDHTHLLAITGRFPTVEAKASHLPLISQLDIIAELILEAAGQG